MSESVNRYLGGGNICDMDHALGRPQDPMKASYRNYFECADENAARAKSATGFWKCNGTLCIVNDAGRKALADHLAERNQ